MQRYGLPHGVVIADAAHSNRTRIKHRLRGGNASCESLG
jgi:hypothetical protein